MTSKLETALTRAALIRSITADMVPAIAPALRLTSIEA
jgi:hypothetical protein